MLENIELMLRVGGYILSGGVVLVTMWVTIAKAKGEVKFKDIVAQVFSTIPLLMIQAEKMFGKGNGEKKLDYVITQLRLQAYENAFQLDKEKAVAEIEKIIETTKNVNTTNYTDVKEIVQEVV